MDLGAPNGLAPDRPTRLLSLKNQQETPFPKELTAKDMDAPARLLRVSINDMKMSAQDLSRSLFRFVV